MHVEKFHKNVAGVMLDHIGRSDSKKNCKRSNENIDPERTHLNYNIAAEIQPLPQTVFLKKRLGEIKVHGNASVHFFSWVVTVPKNLPENEHEKFFKACFDKFCDTYGKENIISCFTHRDESSEHLHCAIIPVVKTDKGEKLCAKEVITRSHLQKAHEEMEEYVSARLGHHVDILNGATKEGNKSLADFKRGKAKEDLEKAKKEADRIIAEAKEKAETTAQNYQIVSEAYENKKSVIEKLENLSLNDEEIFNVEEHKPTPSEPEHFFKVPADIWYHQKVSKEMVEIYSDAQDKTMNYADRLVEYEKANRNLINENITLREKLSQARNTIKSYENWIKKFKSALRKLEAIIPDFRKLFDKIAKEVDEEYEKAEKEIQHSNRNDLNKDIEI